MDIKTFDGEKKQFVRCGRVEGDTFFREVNPDRHFFRKYWGYAIQKDVIETLPTTGVKNIVLCHAGKRLHTDVKTFKRFGMEHGEQLALNIDFFTGDDETKKHFCGCPL